MATSDPTTIQTAASPTPVLPITPLQKIVKTKKESEDIRRELGKSLIDLQSTAIVELYEMHFDIGFEPFRFHAGTNNLTKDIIWRGKKYFSTAIEVEGFEANMLGRLPRPKVTVANTDQVISNVLRDFSDFRNGKFERIKIFLKHLDNENFEDNYNPFGTADPRAYLSRERYIVSQKIMENKNLIQFELITPFDLESLETATRGIYGRYCSWQYRGMGCNYQGDLICQENDKDFKVSPTERLKNEGGFFMDGSFSKTIIKFKWLENKNYTAGQIVYVDNEDLNGIKDPSRTWFVCISNHLSSTFNNPNKSKTYWEKDGCAKTISACKKRFELEFYVSSNGYVSHNDSSSVNKILPFGGFPGTDKFKFI